MEVLQKGGALLDAAGPGQSDPEGDPGQQGTGGDQDRVFVVR